MTESTAPPAEHAEGVKSAPPGEVTTEPPQPFILDLVFARMAENPVSGIARVPVASLADGAGPEQVVEVRRLHQDEMKTVQHHSSDSLVSVWMAAGRTKRHRIKTSKARLLLHETP